ncbi:MAG: hypothetical protein ACLQBA_14840 [Candidatus Binataceae bacterium]
MNAYKYGLTKAIAATYAPPAIQVKVSTRLRLVGSVSQVTASAIPPNTVIEAKVSGETRN